MVSLYKVFSLICHSVILWTNCNIRFGIRPVLILLNRRFHLTLWLLYELFTSASPSYVDFHKCHRLPVGRTWKIRRWFMNSPTTASCTSDNTNHSTTRYHHPQLSRFKEEVSPYQCPHPCMTAVNQILCFRNLTSNQPSNKATIW